METLEAIKSQISALAEQRDALEQRSYNEAVKPLVKGAAGKCFVYRRSCYSCPTRESDYWDVFRQVIEIKRKESLAEVVYRECQIDSYGIATLKTGREPIYASRLPKLFTEGWKVCSRSEFNANWKRAAKRVGGTA